MRSILVTILSFLGFISFHSAAATQNSDVIVVMKTSGGFVAPFKVGWGKMITIYRDGRVVESNKANADTPWEDKLIATLSDEVITNLIDTVSPLTSGDIVYPRDNPRCTDAPTTDYSGRNNAGEMIVFARNEWCTFGTLQNFWEGYRLKNLFHGLDALLPDL